MRGWPHFPGDFAGHGAGDERLHMETSERRTTATAQHQGAEHQSAADQGRAADGELRSAHERLRAGDARYGMLFNLVPVAVYSCGVSGVLEEYNQRAVELWGRAPALGDTDQRFCGSLRLLHPDGSWMPHDHAPMADVLSGKMPEMQDGEVQIERPDGSRVTAVVNIRPLKNEQGQITGAINCFYDVTDRKAAEQLRTESEVRYRRLFEAAHDGILILDVENFRITEVNPFMLRLLDYPREQFIGKELWEIGMFPDKEASVAAMRQLRETGSIRFENRPLQSRSGLQHAVEIVANVYQEGRQRVIQCNVRDISERKRFEKEREALLANEQLLRAEAENANRAKDLFLATLSHEIRTPLNAITGWVSILRRSDCDAAELKEGLAVIDRNTKAQTQLIEDVLDVSRIVSGKLRLEIRYCDLGQAVTEGIEAVRAAAAARNITIEFKLDSAARFASCDPARMQQVVWNLVFNAVKFTPKDGRVRVELMREKSNLRIEVSDTGQGIGPELLPYVFDRFRQADSSTRRKFGGLGLGLSIVKHLVEMHGGTVEARSAGAQLGTTFTIRLPIRAVQMDAEGNEARAGRDVSTGRNGEDGPEMEESLPLVHLYGLRVMVVDDEPDARRLLVKVLERAGAIVMPAGSAAEALEMIKILPPEILVSDIGMPGMDGMDLIREVRRGGKNAKDLPAIALTAFVHKEDRRQALLAGFQLHISKPVDPHELTAIIAGLAGRTEAR